MYAHIAPVPSIEIPDSACYSPGNMEGGFSLPDCVVWHPIRDLGFGCYEIPPPHFCGGSSIAAWGGQERDLCTLWISFSLWAGWGEACQSCYNLSSDLHLCHYVVMCRGVCIRSLYSPFPHSNVLLPSNSATVKFQLCFKVCLQNCLYGPCRVYM